MTTLPKIGAIGAGRMGRQLSVVFAYAGHQVVLVDLKDRPAPDAARVAEEAMAEIRRTFETLAGFGLFDPALVDTLTARVSVHPLAGAEVLADAAFIFEGVPEVMAAKEEAFALTEAACAPDAIIASTTSTIMVDDLSPFIRNKARFLNAHWLNPAYLIPLVEVSPGKDTDPAVTARLKALLEGIGKVPVVCKASPGFIVPRVQAIAINEAVRMAEEGVASVEDLDKAFRAGLGFRFAVIGLLEFIDWGGGDILYYASRYLSQALDAPRFEAPPIIAENMEKGLLGMRTGKGFYDFTKMDVPAYQKERLGQLFGLLAHMGLSRPPVVE